VNLCTRLQLAPEDLPPPPPGLPLPHRIATEMSPLGKGLESPKPGAFEGLSTPSTIASTAASPQFAPLDLGRMAAVAPVMQQRGMPLNQFAFPLMDDNSFQRFQLPLFAGLAPQTGM
jgi:hypothetical protein